MASDKNHRPCLPLKPQEKVLFSCQFDKKKVVYKKIKNQKLNGYWFVQVF